MFDPEKYDTIYNRIRYLISEKSGITYILLLYNFIIFIKSVLNKDQNHYYYNLLLGKCSYQLAEQ